MDLHQLLSQLFLLTISLTNLFLVALICERTQIYAELHEHSKNLEGEVQETVKRMKILSGFLPICASCKKIRNEDGTWDELEQFIDEHSQAKFSHGYCPDCEKRVLEEIENSE